MTTLTDDELLSWLDFGGLASSQPNMQTKYARQLAARFRELLAERRAFIATLSSHAMRLNKLVADLEPVTAIPPKRPLPTPPKDA